MRRKSVRNGTVKIPLGLLFGFIDEDLNLIRNSPK